MVTANADEFTASANATSISTVVKRFVSFIFSPQQYLITYLERASSFPLK
jgi:hypothetical protein